MAQLRVYRPPAGKRTLRLRSSKELITRLGLLGIQRFASDVSFPRFCTQKADGPVTASSGHSAKRQIWTFTAASPESRNRTFVSVAENVRLRAAKSLSAMM